MVATGTKPVGRVMPGAMSQLRNSQASEHFGKNLQVALSAQPAALAIQPEP